MQPRYPLILIALGCAACTDVSSELRTTQALYKDARYEEAQRWLADLENASSDMSPAELARFYYLRGMTAFRLGQPEDALHYLELASVLDGDEDSGLPPTWRTVMERTLAQVMPTSASPHARLPNSM
jgi:hypothetical protein